MERLYVFETSKLYKTRLNNKKGEFPSCWRHSALYCSTIELTKKTKERKFPMDIISQLNLFEDNELGDLEKLYTVLNELPDQALIKALDEERPTGRNDYSNLSMWRAFIAKFVFQHPTIQSLIRELNRNNQLRQICGFQTHHILVNDEPKKILAPSASAFSRSSFRLTNLLDKVQVIFTALVNRLYKELPELGKHLAVDGKIIESHANQTTAVNPPINEVNLMRLGRLKTTMIKKIM